MLESVWELISRVNKYIVENEPWVLAEKPAETARLDSVLFHCAESLRIVAALAGAGHAEEFPDNLESTWAGRKYCGCEIERAAVVERSGREDRARWHGAVSLAWIRRRSIRSSSLLPAPRRLSRFRLLLMGAMASRRWRPSSRSMILQRSICVREPSSRRSV